MGPCVLGPKYLELNNQFVARLGKYLDGRKGLEFMDVGSIGEWGEMHLGLHIPGRWTSEQMAETGFTTSKYVAAYRRVIDAHATAFPHTRVFLNVGDLAEINDYAAIRELPFSPGRPDAQRSQRRRGQPVLSALRAAGRNRQLRVSQRAGEHAGQELGPAGDG